MSAALDGELWCTNILHLPPELIHSILEHTDGVSLAHAEATCRAFREQVYSSDVWRAAVLNRWGWLLHAGPARGAWRDLFVRLHAGSHACFRVVGGCALEGEGFLPEEDLSATFSFSPNRLAWTSTPAPVEVREMAAVVRAADGALVAMGGTSMEFDPEMGRMSMRTLASVELFDEGSWSALPAMQEARCCHGGGVDRRALIYAVGGGESMFRGAACFKTVERYDPAAEAWSVAPSMLEARCGLGAAISHSTDRLFAFGGYAGDTHYLSSCEALDLSAAAGGDARWAALPPMSCARAGCGAATGPDGRVYVVGGGPDGTKVHRSIEALDPRTQAWDTSLAQSHVGRHYNACAFGPDGMLYVSGAFRHDGQLDAVERYDLRADKWQRLAGIEFVVKFSSGAFTF